MNDIHEKIQQQLSNLLKTTPVQDIEKNIKTLLKSMLAKLDLVTREEFETQKQLLASTRAKLEHLEQQMLATQQGANDNDNNISNNSSNDSKDNSFT